MQSLRQQLADKEQVALSLQPPQATFALQQQIKTKVNAPNEFYGNRAKLTTFLNQLQIYYNLRLHEFPSDYTKILFVASYLRGSA